MIREIPERVLETWRIDRLGCYLLSLLTQEKDIGKLCRIAGSVGLVMVSRPVSERRTFYRSLGRDARREFRLGNDERCMEILELRNEFAKYAFY